MYCSIQRVEACYCECGQSVCTAAFKGWRLVTVSVGSLYCSIERVEACYCECGQRWCVLQHQKGGGLLLLVWAVCVLLPVVV